jgi:hypothetical protein
VQGVVRMYSLCDRVTQLRAFEDACAGAGALFSEHGPQDWGRAYTSVAHEVRRLLDGGFTEQDLREAAEAVPGRLPWLHPKYADYNAPREPWQDEVAVHVEVADRLALALRAVGAYDG